MLRKYVFRRTRRGTIDACLAFDEVQLLRSLQSELHDLLDGMADPDHPGDDPVARRLFPTAYSHADDADSDAEAEWQRLMHDELVREKGGVLDIVALTLDRGERKGELVTFELDDGEAAAWLAVLNDVRLALGTRLEVTDEMDYELEVEAGDPADPRTQGLALYVWLTEAQGLLLHAVTGHD